MDESPRRRVPTPEEDSLLHRQFPHLLGGHTSQRLQDTLALRDAIRALFEEALGSMTIAPSATGISVEISVEYGNRVVSEKRRR
jgi:hypothetical protein